MKKNCICGLLVTLLAIPTFAQEVQQDSTINAQVEAAFDAAAAEAAMMDSAIVANADSAIVADIDSAALEEAVAPAKQKRERKERVYPVDSVHYTKGHVLSVGLGFGMSGLWSNGDNIKNGIGFPGFNASLRYTYYFFNWMGFTTGIDFSTYRAEAKLEGVMDLEPGITDHKVGYIHRLDFGDKSSWKEMQDVKMLEVPIALSFRAKPHHVGFLGTVGLKLAFPVYGSYNYKGTLDHLAAFPESGFGKDAVTPLWTEDGLEHNEAVEIKRSTINVVNCNIFGEVGILFQVHPRVDLSVSLYANYGLNDLNSTKHRDRADYAFGPAVYENREHIPFSDGTYQEHNGLFGAAIIDRVQPWNCGIKVAAHFNVNKKSDEQKALENYVAPEMMHDTISLTDTVYIHDTIVREIVIKETIEKKVEQITKMLEKVIIYYNVGDSKTPIINPANLLDSVATIIAENPQIRVAVEGHASSDGNPQLNMMLSENRALNVATLLRAKGVKDSQMEVTGYGSEHPLKFGAADDPTKDRRVEIIPLQSKY
ncbi:MAG: OmpA family protein [Paludibacteraceae bacterium]|nr:OmpA family protein [Paludibacteraceae bacterium]